MVGILSTQTIIVRDVLLFQVYRGQAPVISTIMDGDDKEVLFKDVGLKNTYQNQISIQDFAILAAIHVPLVS